MPRGRKACRLTQSVGLPERARRVGLHGDRRSHGQGQYTSRGHVLGGTRGRSRRGCGTGRTGPSQPSLPGAGRRTSGTRACLGWRCRGSPSAAQQAALAGPTHALRLDPADPVADAGCRRPLPSAFGHCPGPAAAPARQPVDHRASSGPSHPLALSPGDSDSQWVGRPVA